MDEGSLSLRVLLVEDNQHDRLAFCRGLRGGQVACEITECVRAEEALELVRADASSFDVVVADYGLPGLSGMELCKQLLEEEIPLPLVILTGTGSEQLAVEALRAGVDDYIIKDPNRAYLDLLPVVLPNVVQRHCDRLARKQAEEALRIERDNLRNVFRAMEDGVYVVDQQEDIWFANDVLVEEFGPYQGRKCYEYFHDREEVCPWCKNAQVWAGKTVQWEWCSPKNGKTYDLLDTLLTLPDGRVAKLEIFRDITERIRTEKDLRRSEAELKAIYENAPLVMMLVDRERRVVKLNAPALRMARRPVEEAVGLRSGEALRCVHASDAPKGCGFGPACEDCGVRNTVLRTFQSGKAIHRMEASIPYDHPDGPVEMHVLVSTTPLSVSDEDLVLVCLEDVTDRKQAEEALRKAHQQLEERVKERTSQLSMANETLRREITERRHAEERLRAMQAQLAHVARVSTLGEMVAGIAHEINQPLCSVQTLTEATGNLLAAEEPADLGDLREWNAAIAKAVGHTVQIIKRLRGFARPTGSRRSICGINEIVDEAVQLVAVEARRQDAVVRLEPSQVSPLVRVDRVEIQQVVVNLVQNAFEAMDANPVGQREVTVRTELAGEFVEVSVTDRGPGLPSETNLKIFDAFVTTKPSGLGMGLAIAARIAEAHGGELRCTSNPQGGATFHFTLPAARKKQADME